MGNKYGYARVSSAEQNLDRQIDALREYVPEENIVVDKQSGKDLERAGYQALKGRFGLRAGDELYITSLDRLSRTKSDIKEELQWFQNHEVRLLILDLPTSMVQVPKGQEWILEMIQNILVEVLSSIAEQERLTIRKRQQEGINAARSRGKHLGRPKLAIPETFDKVYAEWKAGHLTARAAQRRLGMSASTFYRVVCQYQKSDSKDL